MEAPLATIKQAVTVALDSRMGAMMEVLRNRGGCFGNTEHRPLGRGNGGDGYDLAIDNGAAWQI